MYPINLTKRFLAFMYAVSRHNDPELFVTFLQPNIKKVALLIKIKLSLDNSFLLLFNLSFIYSYDTIFKL